MLLYYLLYFFRRKKEDNMAVIFMGFILVFLICNAPRLILNIHELMTIRWAFSISQSFQTLSMNDWSWWINSKLSTLTIMDSYYFSAMRWNAKLQVWMISLFGPTLPLALAICSSFSTLLSISSFIAREGPHFAKNAPNCTHLFLGNSVFKIPWILKCCQHFKIRNEYFMIKKPSFFEKYIISCN